MGEDNCYHSIKSRVANGAFLEKTSIADVRKQWLHKQFDLLGLKVKAILLYFELVAVVFAVPRKQ